jgi:tetratricopeptide (TPR) repeat protein
MLHNAIEQPGLLSEDQLRELRETVERYPFFGAAQVALSQAYREVGDHRFTDQLSNAAIYTSNRTALYQRFKKERQVELHSWAEPSAKNTELGGSLASAIVEQEDTPVSRIPLAEPTVQAPAELFVPIKAEPDKPLEQERTEESETFKVRVEMLETLDAQILVDAVSKSIELEVQPETEQQEEAANPAADALIPEDENSYAARIYRRAQQLNAGSAKKEESDELSELPNSEDSDLPAFQSTPLSHGIRRIQTTGVKDHQRALIDRFIRTEPQIARGKAGEYQPGNLAKDSLEEDFSFVTETMAVLFAKQGKLDKARKAFRKLMEQHPEKSIYFAAQLKNLEHFKK